MVEYNISKIGEDFTPFNISEDSPTIILYEEDGSKKILNDFCFYNGNFPYELNNIENVEDFADYYGYYSDPDTWYGYWILFDKNYVPVCLKMRWQYLGD